MKKTFLALSIIFLINISSCKKKETVSPAACSTNATEYNTLLNSWVADPTNKTKCQAVVSSIGKLLSCPGVVAADKTAYQQLIDSKPCDGL